MRFKVSNRIDRFSETFLILPRDKLFKNHTINAYNCLNITSSRFNSLFNKKKSIHRPAYDILIIKRLDTESLFTTSLWSKAYKELAYFKYSYLHVDWFNYPEKFGIKHMGYYNISPTHPNSTLYVKQLAKDRLTLVNNIVSQGKVIVSDRLHVGIYSVLIGKPHVIVDERHKKIYNARQGAFYDKPECNEEFIRARYAADPMDAIKIAIEFLKRDFYLE